MWRKHMLCIQVRVFYELNEYIFGRKQGLQSNTDIK